MLKHSQPLEAIMQYQRVFGGLHLMLSNIPLLKTCSYHEFSQMQQVWTHASPTAKDTLAFMWSLGEFNTPPRCNGDILRGSCILHQEVHTTMHCVVRVTSQHDLVAQRAIPSSEIIHT